METDKKKPNINHVAPLFKSDNEEGTKKRTKPKTPIIVLSKEEEGRENKVDQNKGNEEYEDDRENNTTSKMYDPDSDDGLNGGSVMEELDDNSENYNRENITRSKGRPIKNTKKNKPYFLTMRKSSMK